MGSDGILNNLQQKLAKLRSAERYLLFFAILVFVIILVSKFPLLGFTPVITPSGTSITGISVYAIIYLIAQLDERLVEPLSNIDFFVGDSNNKRERTFSLWCLASIIGILLCYFTTGLFQIVGITFTYNSHSLDAILSGILIGGGTKPLHDLIDIIDKRGNI